jgi:hypothetical protein
MQFNSVQKWNDYHMYFNHILLIDNKQLDRTQFLQKWNDHMYFNHILLFNNKQLDRTQFSQLRNVFSNTYILYMN